MSLEWRGYTPLQQGFGRSLVRRNHLDFKSQKVLLDSYAFMQILFDENFLPMMDVYPCFRWIFYFGALKIIIRIVFLFRVDV